MAALAVAESQADEPLQSRPYRGRVSFRPALDQVLEEGPVGGRRKEKRSKSGCPSGISAKISIMLVATDRPTASGFVSSSASSTAANRCGEFASPNVSRSHAEEQVLADRGVVVVASDVEGIDEPVEPVRRERGRTDRRASTMAAASFGSRIGSRVPARPRRGSAGRGLRSTRPPRGGRRDRARSRGSHRRGSRATCRA